MVENGERQDFTHAEKMVPVKSYNDFSRPLVEKRVMSEQEPFLQCVNSLLPQ